MVGIYKITSPTKRIYIGQAVNYNVRLSQYQNLNNSKNQRKLYHSFKKYGISSHIFEFIEECRVEDLNKRERYWQDFYNCLGKGLNCLLTSTSDKSGKLSESTKSRMRGKIRTVKTKSQISSSLKELYKTREHPIKGFKRGTCNNKLNREQVLKIRELLLEGKHNSQIAPLFNISRATIQQIRRGITWQSLGKFKIPEKWKVKKKISRSELIEQNL